MLLEVIESRVLLSAISVLGNGQLIASGSTAISAGNFTDFGYTDVNDPGFALTRTYVLESSDSTAVNLTGSPVVTIEGATADFSVTTQPAITTLDGTHQTAFTITFAPQAGANTLRSATVSISSDGAVSPFTFNIQGTALTTTLAANGYATQIAQLAAGSGAASESGDNLVVNYTGYLLDGTEFDSSLNAGQPFNFQLGQNSVITGWEEGMLNLQVGEQRLLLIPAAEAYGSSGSGAIGPNANLIFVVQRLPQVEIYDWNNATYIYSGATQPTGSNDTDFGVVAPGAAAITNRFAIWAPNGPPGISLPSDTDTFRFISSGPAASEFTGSTLQQYTDPSNGNNYLYLTVTFTPGTTSGLQQATISFPYTLVSQSNVQTPTAYTFAVQATVQGGPTDIALATPSIPENQPVGTAVGTLSTADQAAGDTFTYSLVSGDGSTDNSSFTLNGNVLQTAAVFNYEAQNSYTIRVRATDQNDVYFEKAFTVSVTDVNEAPTDLALSASSIAENQPVGTAVGTLSTTDPDAGDSFSYSLVSGDGSTDNGLFTLNGNVLQTAAAFNYEAQNSYSIRVRTTDSGGLSFEQVFAITVTNVNEAPTNLALSGSSIAENQPTGTAVGTLSTTDPDVGDSFTYSLVSGAGSTDNGSFTLNGNALQTAGVFNYEARNSYSIRVRTTDSGGLSFEKVFAVTVTNVNEAPTNLALSASSIAEKQAVGTAVGTLSVTDPDAGDSFSYSLVSGAGSTDNGSFTLSGNILKTAGVFNYETQGSFSIRVRTTDSGGLFFEKVFAIAVTPVVASPVGTTTTVTSSNAAPTDGQGVTLTATVTSLSGSGMSGTVQFEIDGVNVGSPVTLTGGTATYTVSTLGAGGHAVAAVYSGDGSFAGSTGTLPQAGSSASHLIVTGPDAGAATGPLVKVFDATSGEMNFSFLAYDRGFLGAVRVAMGDFNGDGVPDIVTATGAGGVPLVNVYDGKTGAMFAQFYAYSADYIGGVEIAVADVTGSGHPDIITATDAGGVPLVNVFDSAGSLLLNFWAYDAHYLGGVRIASGDFAGDGKAEIVTSTAGGGQPLVNVFNWVGTLLGNCWGDDPSYTGGLQIAVGDFTSDGKAKVATYRDQGGDAQVKLYNISTQQQFGRLTLGDSSLPSQFRLASTDANGDGIADIVTAPMPGNAAEVQVFSGVEGTLIRKWAAYDSSVTTGLFVAAG